MKPKLSTAIAPSRIPSTLTVMLTIVLTALAATGIAFAQSPQVDLDYAVYAGTANATLGLNVFKGLVAA